jgi:hypothetical protein
VAWAMKKRFHQIELFMKYPVEVQREWLNQLVQSAKNTEWGKKYDYASIRNYETFAERVPISTFEDFHPYIERLMHGEQNLLWPSEVKWFAKSSGTTAAKSKFIPVTAESLEECHFNTGRDMLSMYCNNYPETKLFTGKSLIMAGSSNVNQFNDKSYYGDLSAILVNNLPFWVDLFSTPDYKTALIENFEEKLNKVTDIVIDENVTSITGVPSWTLVLLHRVLEKTGAKDIHEIWPDLELFMHGGVSFTPYREQYKQLIPGGKMRYMETYNASEGFFAIQDQKESNEMLLMLDYGIFYEFIPLDELGKEHPKAYPIDQVQVDTNYAMVISTNAGLWRYMIGDTVRFTSLYPFRIMITGRTKYFINAFGEEVILENAETALEAASLATGAAISDYTAGPVFMKTGESGTHEWIIEFEAAPDNMDVFCQVLDEKLKEVNSDYEAKRYKDMALVKPKVHAAPHGTFYNWMKSRGKLGGQNKVPRLSNNRDYLDPILELIRKG